MPGATSSTITLSLPTDNGSYTVRTYGIAPSNCPSPLSDPVTVTVYSLTNLAQPVDKTICELGYYLLFSDYYRYIQHYQWQYSTDGGVSWNNVNNGTHYNGNTSNRLDVINAPLTYNNYKYRVQILLLLPEVVISIRILPLLQ